MAKSRIKFSPATATEEELKAQLNILQTETVFPLQVFSYMKDFIEDVVGLGANRNAIGAGILAVLSAAAGAGVQWKYAHQTGLCSMWILILGKKASGKGYADSFVMRKYNALNDDYCRKHIKENHKLLMFGEANQNTLKQQVLTNNPRGVLYHLAEFMQHIEIIDRTPVEGTWWLKKWDNEGETIPRKQERYQMKYSYITLYGGTQPHNLERIYAKNRFKDGTIERFLFATIHKETGYEAKKEIIAYNQIAQDRFDESIEELFNCFPCYSYDDYRPIYYNLEFKQQKMYDNWALDTQSKNQLSLDDNRAILERYNVYFKKICVLLQVHREIYTNTVPQGGKIHMEIVENAIRIIDYFYKEAVFCSSQKAPEDILRLANYVKKGLTNKKIAELMETYEMDISRKKKRGIKEYPHLFL